MNKKKQIKIISLAIAGSFFLPIFNWHNYEMNGLNFILSSHIDSYKYFLLLIPGAVFLLFSEMHNKHFLIFNTKILACLPLVSLFFVFFMAYTNKNASIVFYGGQNIFSMIDIGFWAILIFSLLLMIIGLRLKMETRYT